MIWIVAAGVLLLLLSGGGWYYLKHRTYHLKTVQKGVLYRCGLQSFEELENALNQVKPRTLVSLVDDSEVADPAKPQFKRELETFASRSSRGIAAVRVPIKLGGWPDEDQVDRFLKIVQDPEQQPVLVHCAQGVRRTGMMAAAFQLSVLGWSKAQAKESIETFGHSERTVGDIERFIDVYDPGSRRMVQKLKQSKE